MELVTVIGQIGQIGHFARGS